MDPKFLRRMIPLSFVASTLVLGQLPPRTRSVQPPYFPLAVGNQWIYVQRGRIPGDPVTVRVTASSEFGGNTYYQLAGFAGLSGAAWVRNTPSGDLVQYDPATRTDRLWYSFAAPDGASWRSQLPVDCVERARLRTRQAEARAPAGVFSPALLIEYPPAGCADAGITEEFFFPGVGLVRRVETSIAGPRSWELAFARIDGTTISGPELAVSLAIDRPLYIADFMPPVDPARSIPLMTARLTVRNTTTLPLVLELPTGQQYDLAIRDSAGQQVFLWSEGKVFIQALSRLELSPGERTFIIEARLADRGGRTLPAGRYTVEAWLTTTGGKLYSATTAFEIQHVF